MRKGADYIKNYFVSQYGAIKNIDFSPIFESELSEEIFIREVFQICFRSADRADVIIFNQVVQYIIGRKAGRDGPSKMFWMPRRSSVSKMQTAFCSYHERTKESGRSFTLHLKALARATATWTAP